MTWERSDGLRNIGHDSRHVVCSRTYTPPGKVYPRITLALYDFQGIDGGYRFTCDRKESIRSNWVAASIPESLLHEAWLLLAEGQALLLTRKETP